MNRTPSPSSVHASGFNPTDTLNQPSSGTRVLNMRRVPTVGLIAIAFLVSPLMVTSSTAKSPGILRPLLGRVEPIDERHRVRTTAPPEKPPSRNQDGHDADDDEQ